MALVWPAFLTFPSSPACLVLRRRGSFWLERRSATNLRRASYCAAASGRLSPYGGPAGRLAFYPATSPGLSRRSISRLVLNIGYTFSGTATAAPLRGFRPGRAPRRLADGGLVGYRAAPHGGRTRMRCLECGSEAVTERPERTAQGYRR